MCKVTKKEVGFDLNHAKETFMEVKNNFVDDSTLGSQEKSSRNIEEQDVDPLLLATFLKTCTKLLRDKKAVEGLQEPIKNCTGKINIPLEYHAVRKLGKHKERTGCEMRLAAQIGEYEMDQFILDLGSNVNVLPK